MVIRVRAVDHVVLRVSDIGAMKLFYCDVLNCALERELEDIGLIQLRAGTALIDLVPVDSELGKLGGGAPSQAGRNMDHICLQLEKITEEELVAHLVSYKIEVEELAERYGAEGFGRSLYIKDPEGNVVELKISLT
jgi:glyoxylase I family protein